MIQIIDIIKLKFYIYYYVPKGCIHPLIRKMNNYESKFTRIFKIWQRRIIKTNFYDKVKRKTIESDDVMYLIENIIDSQDIESDNIENEEKEYKLPGNITDNEKFLKLNVITSDSSKSHKKERKNLLKDALDSAVKSHVSNKLQNFQNRIDKKSISCINNNTEKVNISNINNKTNSETKSNNSETKSNNSETKSNNSETKSNNYNQKIKTVEEMLEEQGWKIIRNKKHIVLKRQHIDSDGNIIKQSFTRAKTSSDRNVRFKEKSRLKRLNNE